MMLRRLFKRKPRHVDADSARPVAQQSPLVPTAAIPFHNARHVPDTKVDTIEARTSDESSQCLQYTTLEPPTDPITSGRPASVTKSSREDGPPSRRKRPVASLGIHVRYEPPDALPAVADVVFVHGITGNSSSTWCWQNSKNSEDYTYWPEDLVGIDIPDVRILTFGYDADVVGIWTPASTNSIGKHAENLLGSIIGLQERSNTESRPLIFVMHSLGGLVVQNALDLSRSSPEPHLQLLESATIGLVFMGTPHFGSDKARWGSLCTTMLNILKRSNKAIVKVLQPDSEPLAVIQKKFHEILRIRSKSPNPIHVTCFYEELPMVGIGKVVEDRSATIPGYPSYGIHDNHQGMVQFGPDDPDYDKVRTELMRWVKEAHAKKSRLTDLQQECLRTLYFSGLDKWEDEICDPIGGSSSWIWDAEKCTFATWLDQGSGLYWIQGRSSSGKSTLMKFIVNRAKQIPASFTVASYHITNKNSNPVAQSKEGIVRALLWKLLRQQPKHFPYLLQHFNEMKSERSDLVWKPSVLEGALRNILAESVDSRQLWIFIDGLDEYSGDMLDAIEFCRDMAAGPSANVRVCVASRPEREIAYFLDQQSLPAENTLLIEKHTSDDIAICSRRELKRVKGLEPRLIDDLVSAISSQANGLFIWAKLASRDISRYCMKYRGASYEDLLSRLGELPQECNELYSETLSRRVGTPDYGEAVLMMAVVAIGQKNFSLAELAAILRSTSIFGGLELADPKSMNHIIAWTTGGLLETRSGRIYFSHETVSTFTAALLIEQKHLRILKEAHRCIVRSCLDFMVLASSKDLLLEATRVATSDLQDYSIQHWIYHFQTASELGYWTTADTTRLTIVARAMRSWQLAHLARCADYERVTVGHSTNAIELLLAISVLSMIPILVFGDRNGDYVPATQVELDEALSEDGLSLEKSSNWQVLISIQCAANYTISFHAHDAVLARTTFLSCFVSRPWSNLLHTSPQNCKDDDIIREALANAKIHDQQSTIMYRENEKDWEQREESLGSMKANLFELRSDLLEPIIKVRHRSQFHLIDENADVKINAVDFEAYAKPLTITPCSRKQYNDIAVPKARLCISGQALQQIKTLIRQYIHSRSNIHYPSPGTDQQVNILAPIDGWSSRASPMHHAAYYGLDYVLGELGRLGACAWRVSRDFHFGTPLMAAVWGAYEAPHLHQGHLAVRVLLTLDKTKVTLNKSCNAAHLGSMAPLRAAVVLYINYKRRFGQQPYALRDLISVLLEYGATIDPKTRGLMRCRPTLNAMLVSYHQNFASPHSHVSGTSIIESFGASGTSFGEIQSPPRRHNASIGHWGGFSTRKLSGLARMGHTVD